MGFALVSLFVAVGALVFLRRHLPVYTQARPKTFIESLSEFSAFLTPGAVVFELSSMAVSTSLLVLYAAAAVFAVSRLTALPCVFFVVVSWWVVVGVSRSSSQIFRLGMIACIVGGLRRKGGTFADGLRSIGANARDCLKWTVWFELKRLSSRYRLVPYAPEYLYDTTEEFFVPVLLVEKLEWETASRCAWQLASDHQREANYAGSQLIAGVLYAFAGLAAAAAVLVSAAPDLAARLASGGLGRPLAAGAVLGLLAFEFLFCWISCTTGVYLSAIVLSSGGSAEDRGVVRERFPAEDFAAGGGGESFRPPKWAADALRPHP